MYIHKNLLTKLEHFKKKLLRKTNTRKKMTKVNQLFHLACVQQQDLNVFRMKVLYCSDCWRNILVHHSPRDQ